MRKVIGFCILFIFVLSESTSAQVDTCLVPWGNASFTETDSLGWNWDSVMYNKCIGGSYAKNYFEVSFLYYVLHDSIGDLGLFVARNWRDIDQKFTETRKGFAAIEERFGTFSLLPNFYPDSMSLDTSKFYNKQWFVNFDTYVNIDSAVYLLRGIPGLDSIDQVPAEFDGGILWHAGVRESSSQTNIQIWPQPCNSTLFIQGDKPFGKILPLVYDALGRLQVLPEIFVTDRMVRIDVSKLENGEFFINSSGHISKVLVRK